MHSGQQYPLQLWKRTLLNPRANVLARVWQGQGFRQAFKATRWFGGLAEVEHPYFHRRMVTPPFFRHVIAFDADHDPG
jgi:hypothetical protein